MPRICNSDDPVAAWFVCAAGLCSWHYVCIPQPCVAKVNDSRWGCGPIKCGLFGLMNVWWAWREAQVSRGNALPTAVAVNKSKHTEERSAMPQHSGEPVCLRPVLKNLSNSLTCLRLSLFLLLPYKHWHLWSNSNEYRVTDWLRAPRSFPRLHTEEIKPLPSIRKQTADVQDVRHFFIKCELHASHQPF